AQVLHCVLSGRGYFSLRHRRAMTIPIIQVGEVHAGAEMPTMYHFLETCWAREPVKMVIFQGSGMAATLLTVWIGGRHWLALRTAPPSLRRGLYIQVAMLPGVLAVLSMLTLLCPTPNRFLSIVQKTYEAFVLHKFGVFMFMMVLAESELLRMESGRACEDTEIVKIVQEGLAKEGPKKHFGALPLGCCFRSCMSEHDLSSRHLFYVNWFIQQFVLLVPALAVVSVYLFGVLETRTFVKVMTVFHWTIAASNLVCIYGLVILFVATRPLLKRWNTKQKFIAIKVVLVISIWQDRLIELIASGSIEGSGSCFQYSGWDLMLDDTTGLWMNMEIHFYCAWALALEMVLVVLLMRSAFAVEELKVTMREVHHDVLQLGMSRTPASAPPSSTGGSAVLCLRAGPEEARRGPGAAAPGLPAPGGRGPRLAHTAGAAPAAADGSPRAADSEARAAASEARAADSEAGTSA
ncbi:unnamed protein product, partial [Prorocentrum cordatum]